MGFFSGPKRESRTDSYSGLRGLGVGNEYANQIGARTAGDYDFLINSLTNKARSPFDIGEFGQLNNMGLTNSQMGAFNTAVNNVANQFSSGLANRGFVSPDNVMAIAGSAAQNAAPGFLDTISQNLMNKYMLPENVRQNRFAQLNQAMGMAPQLLGQEAHTTSKQSAPGIGYTFGSALGQSLGSSLGSWASPEAWGRGGSGGKQAS